MPRGLPLPKTLLLIVGLFAWFSTSVESDRSTFLKQFSANPRVLLTDPLLAIRGPMARDGDDRLYFNYAQLMFGHAPDLAHLATKDQGDPVAARARLERAIRPDGGPRLPYRDFPVEYPPVSLLLMLLPRFFVDNFPAYRVFFAGLTGSLFLLSAWLAARVALLAAPETPSVERIWRRLAWLLAATGPIICQRFDVLPAALLMAAIAALAHRRDALAGIALGFAIMTKLYPLLLFLPLGALFIGAGHRRRALVVGATSALTVVAIAAPFLVLTPGSFLRSNLLYGARPFHFESLFGSMILALHGPAVVIGSFGSRNVISPGWLLQVAGILMWGGLAALAVAAWKRGRALAHAPAATFISAMTTWTYAGLVFILCTSKVLSPQFLIWLLPLGAVWPGVRGRRVFIGTLVTIGLTQVFYPPLYGHALRGHPGAILGLLTRNACLVALAIYVLRSVAHEIVDRSAHAGQRATHP